MLQEKLVIQLFIAIQMSLNPRKRNTLTSWRRGRSMAYYWFQLAAMRR